MKISMLPCVMPMVQILLISYFGMVLFCPFILFATVSSHCFGLPVVAFPKRNLLISYRYSQAGTPTLKVTSSYSPEAHTFTLKFRYEIVDNFYYFLLWYHC